MRRQVKRKERDGSTITLILSLSGEKVKEGDIMSDLTSRVEFISPELAQEYLKHNSINPRKMSRRTVNSYAADMQSGTWKLNGEPIIFDADGNLLNGQHRLEAIKVSGVTVPMLVVRGVESGLRVFDYGHIRQITQEVPNVSNAEASAAAMVVMNAKKSGNTAIPKATTAKYLREHLEDIRMAHTICISGVHHAVSRKSMVIAACYLMLRDGINPIMLTDFFTMVNQGIPSKERICSSAFVLRNFLMDKASAPTLRSHTYTNNMRVMEMVILAFQDFTKEVDRKRQYKITRFKNAEYLLQKVRQMDGLTDD